MPIKLSASVCKKLPDEQQYSSKSYLASLEIELSSNLTAGELQQEIQKTYQQLEQAVDDQIAGKTTRTKEPVLLSSGQLKYIQDLGKAKKMRLADLNAEVNQMFDAQSINELSMKDASRYLEHLMQKAA